MNRREDGRLHPDRIGGPGAAVGDTLVWDGMRWVPSAPSGGGLLGAAGLTVEFGLVTSDGGIDYATSVTIDWTEGDPDLSLVGETITWGSGPCAYMIWRYGPINIDSNAVSSDFHQIKLNDGRSGLIDHVTGGLLDTDYSTFAMVLANGESGIPSVEANCTGGTDRTYEVTMYLEVYRMAQP